MITIHTDGSCHGNPGPGGYAAIIQIPRRDDLVVQGGERHTTNNRMELTAVIQGLKALTLLADIAGFQVAVRSDSNYVVNAFNERWLQNGSATAGSIPGNSPSRTATCGSNCWPWSRRPRSNSSTSAATPGTR